MKPGRSGMPERGAVMANSGEYYALCVGFLKDLVAMETVNPPGHERKATEYIAGKLAEHGIPCDLMPLAENRANVISRPLGEGPAIVLSGHLDVVPAGEGWEMPPFQLTRKDGRFYGRGVCDMKGGIAAMMAAAIWAKRQGGEHRPFRLAFVADEELYGSGTQALLEAVAPQEMKYVILGEPTEREIHIAHRGALRFKACISGRSCHAGAPQMGVNAIECMARVMEAVRAVNEDLQGVRHPVLPPPTMCCTMVSGGTKDNIVPDRCEMVVDCRPGTGDTAEGLAKALRDKVDALGGLPAGAELELNVYVNVPAGGVSQDSDIVRWAGERFAESFDSRPVIGGFPACCDLSQFTARGIQAILYGPGSIRQAHTVNEFLDQRELEKAFTFYCHCLTGA